MAYKTYTELAVDFMFTIKLTENMMNNKTFYRDTQHH